MCIAQTDKSKSADDAAMADVQNKGKKGKLSRSKNRFKTLQHDDRETIIVQGKAPSTHQATKLWVNYFDDSVAEKKVPKASEIQTEHLPETFEYLYTELRKTDGEGEYKLSTVKCI